MLDSDPFFGFRYFLNIFISCMRYNNLSSSDNLQFRENHFQKEQVAFLIKGDIAQLVHNYCTKVTLLS